MQEIRVDRVETFACEGADGTAPNRPRVLLQVLSSGEAAAICSYRQGVNYSNSPTPRMVYFCLASQGGSLEARNKFDQALDVARNEADGEMSTLEQNLKTVEKLRAQYVICPFQASVKS